MEILPPELQSELESRLESGQYESLAQLLREALKVLDDTALAEAWVEKKLGEAEESGPAVSMTAQDWDDIEREGLERICDRQSTASRHFAFDFQR